MNVRGFSHFMSYWTSFQSFSNQSQTTGANQRVKKAKAALRSRQKQAS